MWDWVRIVGWSVVSAVRSRRNLALENIALRHQLMVLQRQFGSLRLKDRDRLFWICLRRGWVLEQDAVGVFAEYGTGALSSAPSHAPTPPTAIILVSARLLQQTDTTHMQPERSRSAQSK